jgi:hypothetical protein
VDLLLAGPRQWLATHSAPVSTGILGPWRQAYNIVVTPLYHSAQSTSASPSWHNVALIAALNNLDMQQGGEGIMP